MTPQEIASRLGLKRVGREWRGTCPACGYGNGAFVLSIGRNGRPVAWCASCQDRSVIVRAIGGDVPSAPAPEDVARDATIKARKQDRAIALWNGSEPATGTLADRYLTLRGLPGLAASPALRFRSDTPHPAGGRLPALVALVCDVAGTPVALHRIYLSRDGSKALVVPAKASLGRVWGGVVRLTELRDGAPIVVAEGIESAASAGRLMGWPAWAAVSAGNLARNLVLPPEARDVVIAADPDPPGLDAARQAWLRWHVEGRNVRVATPTGDGDFNDLLRARDASHG